MNQSATDTLPHAGAAPADADVARDRLADVGPGTLLAERYALEEPVGRGASGWVWRAKHVVIGKSFAVKLLRAQDGRALGAEAVSRMLREAKTLSRFAHPNVIAVTDFGYLSEHEPFIVMELLTGESLRAVLAGGRLAWPRARALGLQMLDGLEAAHAEGVIHRDIKPGNLFVCPEDKLKIIDFGLAGWRLADDVGRTRITAHGDVFGTPQYMSPEQIAGKPTDARTDLYSLGCVLFEMLAGRPPAQGTPAELLYQHVYADPPPLHELVDADVPRYVCDLILKCLHKDPRDRPQSVAALRQGLVYGGPTQTRRPPARRRWGVPAAAGLALAFAATMLAGAAWDTEPASVMPTVQVAVPRVEPRALRHTSLRAVLPTLEVAERKPSEAVTPAKASATSSRSRGRGRRGRGGRTPRVPRDEGRAPSSTDAARPRWDTDNPDIKDPFAHSKAR